MPAPFDIGLVLRRSFQLYGRYAGSLLPATLLINGVGIVVACLQRDPPTGAYLALTGVAAVIGIFVSPWFAGALVRLTLDDELRDGEQHSGPLSSASPTIWSAFKATQDRYWSLVGIMIVYGLAVGIGLVFFVVPGLYLAALWIAAMPVIVAEGVGFGDSFNESERLTEGSRWRVLVAPMAIGFVPWILASVGSFVDGPLVIVGQTLVALAYPAIGLAIGVTYLELRRVRGPAPAGMAQGQPAPSEPGRQTPRVPVPPAPPASDVIPTAGAGPYVPLPAVPSAFPAAPAPVYPPQPGAAGLQPANNSYATASLVCGLLFCLCGLTSILAIVFGLIARDQIKKSGGAQTGDGMATAGIILGAAGILLWVVLIIVGANTPDTSNNGNDFDFGQPR